jgi:hypothetical protein
MASRSAKRIFWVAVFAVAFAIVEAAVVVYLRAIYYPRGFIFPLSLMDWRHVGVETAREGATMVMLACVGILAGQSRWQRTGFFLIGFAVWDIFYYLWLKIFLDWPASFLDWDVLFLIPVPWISPVLAPTLISVVLLLAGIAIVLHEGRHPPFRLHWYEAIATVAATVMILYTFMADTASTLHGALPEPYNYSLFSAGMAAYGIVLVRLLMRLSMTGRSDG